MLQNTFRCKIAEHYSIRGQRIRIFFRNKLRLWRNILNVFQGGMNGRAYPRTRTPWADVVDDEDDEDFEPLKAVMCGSVGGLTYKCGLA